MRERCSSLLLNDNSESDEKVLSAFWMISS